MSLRNQWKMLGKAIALASRVHEGVVDKGGYPYILHPLHVMNMMQENDPELRQIAVMHDVVEDSEMTINDLSLMGFSARVTDALALLTHDKSESYSVYVKKIKTNPDATKVKQEDISHNSLVSRLKGIGDKDVARMIKYNKAYLFLTDRINEID